MCENRRSVEDWESLVLACLEIGFRHLDVQTPYVAIMLTHTEHHQELVRVVFESQNDEAIADLLHAWTARGHFHEPAYALLSFCTEHFVSLHLMPSSSRLRRLIIRSVEVVGYEGFGRIGVERFVQLLNHLHVMVKDMDDKDKWIGLLLDAIQSSKEPQRLSHWYWELLVELAISKPWWPRGEIVYTPQIITCLIEAEEWSKLEYWIGTVWMIWPPGSGGATEEELGHSMALLLRQQPDAIQTLEQWMERWSQQRREDIPQSFQRLCKVAHETA